MHHQTTKRNNAMKNYFNEIKNFFKTLKIRKEKEFVPKTDTMTIAPTPIVKRKHTPTSRLTKGGRRYRTIKHDANKKANSPAYTQVIWLS